MKKITAFIFVLAVSGTTFGQNTRTTRVNPTPAQRGASNAHKSAVGGMMTDARRHPIPGVQAFIYQVDSSIIASGFTDSTGAYETNSVLPGKYDVKIVYPSAKAILIKGVVIKAGVTQISFRAEPPAADTSFPYTVLVPKSEPKKTKK
jgi:hypothetical protein